MNTKIFCVSMVFLVMLGAQCFALADGYNSIEVKLFGFFQYGGDIPHPSWELGRQGHNIYELGETAIVLEKDFSFSGSIIDGLYTFTGSFTPDLKTIIELTVVCTRSIREESGMGTSRYSFTVVNVPFVEFGQYETAPFKIYTYKVLGTDAGMVQEVLKRVKNVTFTRNYANGKRIYLEKILDKFIHDPSIYTTPMGFRSVISRFRIPGIICNLKLWPPHMRVDFRKPAVAKPKSKQKPPAKSPKKRKAVSRKK
jgi:hypothetical protein